MTGVAARTVPSLPTVTRTDTTIVPRIVCRAPRETSGITSLMGDGGASAFGRLTTGAASPGEDTGAGGGGAESGAASVTAGAGVGSGLNRLMPTQLTSTATAPRISSSAPLLKRGRTGAWGGSFGVRFTRITSRPLDGVLDWGFSSGSGTSAQSPATGLDEVYQSRSHCLPL